MSDLQIFTENIEPAAVNQIYTLLAQPPFADAKVRIMPDVHYGSGCVVGFTSTMQDAVIPNVIGVDIGCGMRSVELGQAEFDLKELDDFIRKNVPCGSMTHKKIDGSATGMIQRLHCFSELKDMLRLEGSLGTLGGGNHFIEVDADAEGNRYLVVHSGSRNLGLQVAKIYQRLAIETCKGAALPEREQLIADLKKAGRVADIPQALQKLTEKYAAKSKVPADFCYLDGANMQDYMHDMRICQEFALRNREKIAGNILRFLGLQRAPAFETVHNYIDDANVIRKGAISARKGEKVIIPMNMRDGCLICEGLGNPDWNYSAPHGAGRLLRRSEVKELVSVEEYKQAMQGIYSTTVNESTLDESPMAYKDAEEIKRLIAPTVRILNIVKPIYNFKAGSQKDNAE